MVAALAAAGVSARAEATEAWRELGRPLLRGYPPGEHLYAPMSQTMVQDAAGWVYFANNVDLLAHDGTRWFSRLLPATSGGIRQFATAPDGTIYAGGSEVIGYLRGAGPAVEFVSLADRLPGGVRGAGEVRFVAAAGDAVCFADDERILIWRGGKFSAIPCAAPRGRRGARLHGVGSEILVSAPGWPLQRLRGDALVPVADDAVLRDNQLIAVVAGPAPGSLVVLTAERGFFAVDAAGRVAPWATEMNRWLAGRRVFRARQLGDGSWVVAFAAVDGGGGLRFRPDGHCAGPIGAAAGMYTNDVRDFVPDREGGLWVALDAGAARLEWPAPVTRFDVFNGLGYGAVRAVARHAGVLHVETEEGVYRLRPAGDDGRGAHFERLGEAADAELQRNLAASRDRGASVGAGWPVFVRQALGRAACVLEETTAEGPVRWIGGSEGLLRWETARSFAPAPPLVLQLDAVGVTAGGELPPEHEPVGFRYLAVRQQRVNGVTYRTRLTGRDRAWSAWGEQRDRSFPHLAPGSYTFEVRARDANGVESTVQSLAFTVLAPWWLTPSAFASYAGAIGLLVAATVRWRTRALERRAAELEKTVETRTAELAEKNRELTRLHRLEFDEKIAARLGEEKARLEVLRYQLNPHFLFNTLASISASLPAGPSVGRSMVERLAEFCRLTLHRGEQDDWTTLGDELRLLRAYLAIEQSRWGELLEVDIRHDSTLDTEKLPYFLLLPLVENALKYGQATSPDRVGIRLATRRTGDGGIAIEVANTGEWVEPAAEKTVATLGIGLENLRQRLARHYPGAHRLEFAAADGWVTARLRLAAPARRAGAVV
ncbi:MAG: hypothetical protein C0502_01550 [Opitutus sp.]|nr:hypothetical protein [Opitutus sp.]